MDILNNVLDGIDSNYDQKCVPLLWLSGQEIDARMNQITAKHGVTALQNLILYYLSQSDKGTMTVNELSDCLTQKANTSRSVAQLIKMDFVTKERSHEDERVVLVTITNKGRELKCLIEDSMKTLYTLGLNDADAKSLYNLLFKVMSFQAMQ